MVYASSSSVYGDAYYQPKVEEKIGKPLSPYAVSKHANELYTEVFALNYGMTLAGSGISMYLDRGRIRTDPTQR
jgi:UDP-N-acetylglucosamine 4-epimerase